MSIFKKYEKYLVENIDYWGDIDSPLFSLAGLAKLFYLVPVEYKDGILKELKEKSLEKEMDVYIILEKAKKILLDIIPDFVDWESEMEKCKKSPYYFYTTYCKVQGQPPTTIYSEEEFNNLFTKTFKNDIS